MDSFDLSTIFQCLCLKDRSVFKDKEETSVDIDLRIILRSLGEEGNILNLLDLVSRGSKNRVCVLLALY